MRAIALGFLVLLPVLTLAPLARADVAPPGLAETVCPRGAVAALPEVDPNALDPRGRPLQAWPYCTPTTCESDADCDGGRACSSAPIGLCIITLEGPGERTRRTVIPRGCEPDGTCLRMEARCEQGRRCVPPAEGAQATEGTEPEAAPTADEAPQVPAAPLPATAVAGGCGCRVAGGPVSPGALAALVGVAVLVATRGRRR